MYKYKKRENQSSDMFPLGKFDIYETLTRSSIMNCDTLPLFSSKINSWSNGFRLQLHVRDSCYRRSRCSAQPVGKPLEALFFCLA